MLSAHVSFSIFMWTSVITLLVLGYFTVKLIISLTKLTDNANVIASSIQKEIEPTLKELNQAAKFINSIAENADTKMQNSKDNLASLVNIASCINTKLKGFSKGILKGISFGLGLFRK